MFEETDALFNTESESSLKHSLQILQNLELNNMQNFYTACDHRNFDSVN